MSVAYYTAKYLAHEILGMIPIICAIFCMHESLVFEEASPLDIYFYVCVVCVCMHVNVI